MIKAYMVSSDADNGYTVIAFASSSSRARTIASRHIDYDGFLNLRSRRCPEADVYATPEESVLRSSHIYRLLGWHQETCAQCELCELYQFDGIEESYVDEEGDGLCVSCRKGLVDSTERLILDGASLDSETPTGILSSRDYRK